MAADFLDLEDGTGDLLLETGDKLLLESSTEFDAATFPWGSLRLTDLPPMGRQARPWDGGLSASAIPVPYDFPITIPGPDPVRRVALRHEGFAAPVAPLPYDFPLQGPLPGPLLAPTRVHDTRSPAIGQADVVGVPDLSSAFGDLPVRRPRTVIATQSPEFGRADPPPPPAPDLSALVQADPPRRRPQPIGLTHQETLLPPGFPADWYPSAEIPPRRRRFLTAEAFASPVDRPVIPFDPAQGVADLPQPPLGPRARSHHAALSTIPPVGPPSSALEPPGVMSWQGVPQPPVRPAAPRQPQDAAAQNLDPIPEAAPPEGSWYPFSDLPPVRLSRRPWLEAFTQNLDPIETPAYLASFWLSYVPPGPFPRLGLRPALQQWLAEAPPIIEVLVHAGSWRGEFPAQILAARRLTPEAFALPPNLTLLGDAYGCITLNAVRVTQPLLLAPTVTGPALLDVSVTSSTLLLTEVC